MNALVIDDEAGVRCFLAEVLRDEGWDVAEADSAERAFELLHERQWSLVFCDVMLGGEDGYAVLRRFQQEQPEAQVVLMTGHGSAAGALDATAGGAYDYLMKPFDAGEVQALARAVGRRRARRPPSRSKSSAYRSDVQLIGTSPAFVEALKLVGRAALTTQPVLITGESGTGKEVVARAIHTRGPRAAQPFVAVNCGALPPELIESELFGHARGSFTGAERDRPGLFEEADGGTLFLDEITETAPTFQVKLLRALQEGEVRRVGSNRTRSVNVRVIAATNRDVESEVRSGRFRQDLLYRLDVIGLRLPPLRERREDIPALVEHFAARLRAPGRPELVFSDEAVRALENYDWPGNVRELENAVSRAAAFCDTAVRVEDLPERVRNFAVTDLGEAGAPDPLTAAADAPPGARVDDAAAWPSLDELELRYAERALAHTRGNKHAAARLLKIDRKTLSRILSRGRAGEGTAAEDRAAGPN